jgi:hypothetical protein
MVDVITRRLTGVVDEDNTVEVIAQPKDETHDGKRGQHSKVVEVYFRSAVMLRRKKLRANNSTNQKYLAQNKFAKSSVLKI